LFKREINIEFLLPYLKILTNSEKFSERSIKIQFSFAIIAQFSPVYIYCRLPEQLSELQAAFGTTLESQAAVGKPEQSP
jgi:hypothetical protein